MLRPEKAREELKTVRVKGGTTRRVPAVTALPRELAGAGLAFLERDANGKEIKDGDRCGRLQARAAELLDGCSARQREQVFAALFPKLGAAIEATWQLLHRLPFQPRYHRLPFRAPHTATATRGRRIDWLKTLVEELRDYREDVVDIEWVAAWTPHLNLYRPEGVGLLLAGVLDAGGSEADRVFEILRASATGEHEIGGMGRHVTRAFLTSSRPDGWQFMEKLLLAAQRQEGLRQSILESIGEAHPEAFRRMLRLIRDKNLTRFSATVRAADVWLGMRWNVEDVKSVKHTLDRLLSLLEEASARRAALRTGSGEDAYFALWALAFEDAVAAVGPAAVLLKDAKVERRFAAVSLLTQLRLPEARPALLGALGDADFRIALTALEGMPGAAYETESEEKAPADDLFERVEDLLARVPAKPTALAPLLWPWTARKADRKSVADRLVGCLGGRPPTRLIPHLPLLGPGGRAWAARLLGQQKKWDEQTRTTLCDLVGDANHSARTWAVRALAKRKVTPAEVVQLEGLLTRKGGDLRQGVLGLLLAQKDAATLESADRLLASGRMPQRLGGLDLLRQLAEAGRSVKECQERGHAYREQHKKLSAEEEEALDVLVNPYRERPTLDDALGLMDPSKLTPVVPPQKRKVVFMTPAAIACLKALDELVHQYRETPRQVETRDGIEERLLGSAGLPGPDRRNPPEEEVKRLLLREVWEDWWQKRPKAQRDRDGRELLRAHIWLGVSEWDWEDWQEARERSAGMAEALDTLAGGQERVELRYEYVVETVLDWLLWLHPSENTVDYFLDAAETAYALVPKEELLRKSEPNKYWYEIKPFELWLDPVFDNTFNDDGPFPPGTAEQRNRLWQLLHWRDRPCPGARRVPPALDVLLGAFERGVANEHDVLEELLGSRDLGWGTRDFGSLMTLTDPRRSQVLRDRPQVRNLVDRCRERILEVELPRGEAATAATGAVRQLQSLTGLSTLQHLLASLGKRPFEASQHGTSRAGVLTHLISVTFPAEEDTPVSFAHCMRAAVVAGHFPSERLIDLAFVAPRWTAHVEQFLGWSGFTEGVWWFFGHMPNRHTHIEELLDDPGADTEDADEDRAKPGVWERMVRERTPLNEEEQREGAVDVAWFRRTYALLGAKRWRALADAAALGSTRQAARKALYLSEVLLGKAKKRDLVALIRKKRRREAVRLLGLLPLATGERREQDLANRYRVLQEYRRYANTLGPMTKPSALRSTDIGLENLARTAGYPDPIRLEWSMGAKAAADLARGPLVQTVEGLTLTLALDAAAQPELTVQHGDKVLTSVPTRLRKHPKIVDLVERKTDLKRQASRLRESLEAAMCRGDAFTGKELRRLLEHPLLAPLLTRLVLTGESAIGYPERSGQVLRHHSGQRKPINDDVSLRIAHPHDLLAGGEWDRWQHECFKASRVQPFKQVFRELYVPTTQEKTATVSRRYQGQQIQQSQGMALFAARGWRVPREVGDEVSKTFHALGLTATVEFRHHGWTPAQVEGPAVEGVSFSRRGEWKSVSLSEVPPRIFSEVMRDLDLVVSVAHAGGVDPEASASTVEMRTALLRETCELLKLDNVRFKGSHALIDGVLGHYSVHIGSAVVHRLPGGSVCMVPVPGDQRGRLFLPFADDDPRTAELLAKVLLLARDSEIHDPIILDQLRAKP